MAGARHGARALRALCCRPLFTRASPCAANRGAARWVSTGASSSPPAHAADMSEIESTGAYTTPEPDKAMAEAFGSSMKAREGQTKPPGNRYQYHPPKYNRGPLHPVQVPPSSDPTARDFVPGPFGYPRLLHTYESTVAPDLMTLTYTHKPPGTPPSTSQKGHLREWDDSSPYFKNRPRRQPRGRSSTLALIERDISWDNIPEILGVSVYAAAPMAAESKEYLHVAMAVVQAITGRHSETTALKSNALFFGVRQGAKAGVKASLRGEPALEFVDKVVTLVLPSIKDWPGIRFSTGDGSGNISFGLTPNSMAFFPELGTNYDMYPQNLIPGCNIYIETSATSDRQGRLLMQALGFPFCDENTIQQGPRQRKLRPKAL